MKPVTTLAMTSLPIVSQMTIETLRNSLETDESVSEHELQSPHG